MFWTFQIVCCEYLVISTKWWKLLKNHWVSKNASKFELSLSVFTWSASLEYTGFFIWAIRAPSFRGLFVQASNIRQKCNTKKNSVTCSENFFQLLRDKEYTGWLVWDEKLCIYFFLIQKFSFSFLYDNCLLRYWE